MFGQNYVWKDKDYGRKKNHDERRVYNGRKVATGEAPMERMMTRAVAMEGTTIEEE